MELQTEQKLNCNTYVVVRRDKDFRDGVSTGRDAKATIVATWENETDFFNNT